MTLTLTYPERVAPAVASRLVSQLDRATSYASGMVGMRLAGAPGPSWGRRGGVR